MSLEKGSLMLPAYSRRSKRAANILARQDRIPIWATHRLLIGIIGIGFFFTFFDIGDINVSFVQTCKAILEQCTSTNAGNFIGRPVLMNLAGYVIGALIFGLLADRYGRRDMLFFTMVITGIGSLYTVFVGDYLNFIIARAITGVGVGADLALVNIYISELAPSSQRVKYASLIFIPATIGITLSAWLGLYLTTPPVGFPSGLFFALGTPNFQIGWRILYGIGSLLTFVGIFLRFDLPESPRWLLSQGRLSEAERIVSKMERKALACMKELPPTCAEITSPIGKRNTGYSEIFGNNVYLKRTVLLLVIWLIGYITVYAIIADLTVLLTALKYPLSEAGLIATIGTSGSVICGVITFFVGERLERKMWILIAALLTIVGGIMTALSRDVLFLAFLGSIVLTFGSYLWLPITYTWSTECYPTRARASGFALVDGIGQIGGGIGVYVISPLSGNGSLQPLETFLLIGGFLLVSAGLAIFGPATKAKRFDEVSP